MGTNSRDRRSPATTGLYRSKSSAKRSSRDQIVLVVVLVLVLDLEAGF